MALLFWLSIPIVLLALTLFLIGVANPRVFLWLVFLGLIAGELGRISISSDTSSAILAIDIAMVGYVGGGLVALITQRKKLFLATPLIMAIAFLGWATISLIIASATLASHDIFIAVSYLLRLWLMLGVIFVTAWLAFSEEQEKKIIQDFIWAGMVLVALGFIQLILFPNFAFMAKYGWDPHFGRLLSTFFDPNFFGMYLVMIFSLMTALFFTIAKPSVKTWLLVGIVVTAAAIILTYSRSTYLAFAISLAMILAFRSWRLMIIIFLILGLTAIAIPRTRDRIIGALTVDTTAQDRIHSWEQTLTIVQDRPIMGVGYDAFGPAQLAYGFRQNLLGHAANGSDSSLLLILATTGIVGLLLYLFIWLSLLAEALLVYKKTKKPLSQGLALAMIGIIPAYLIHSQFVNGLVFPLLFVPFAILAGLIIYNARHIASQTLDSKIK